ncbi:uncharacterized protein DSM5745_00757 [Aspergillus mulundensis]|uniref:Uncharacterized protein n=1 Tax=Aspergillus mulundensis TaxID=1810919 RepID=A0A3D8T4F6_9EURO|nr:hypothetical protein DSM5745_00757 [Aspergillus mulundensis]RDW93435.1 hypothetical protein DSM5745_00757 [Aspergillus mulundensis]
MLASPHTRSESSLDPKKARYVFSKRSSQQQPSARSSALPIRERAIAQPGGRFSLSGPAGPQITLAHRPKNLAQKRTHAELGRETTTWVQDVHEKSGPQYEQTPTERIQQRVRVSASSTEYRRGHYSEHPASAQGSSFPAQRTLTLRPRLSPRAGSPFGDHTQHATDEPTQRLSLPTQRDDFLLDTELDELGWRLRRAFCHLTTDDAEIWSSWHEAHPDQAIPEPQESALRMNLDDHASLTERVQNTWDELEDLLVQVLMAEHRHEALLEHVRSFTTASNLDMISPVFLAIRRDIDRFHEEGRCKVPGHPHARQDD